MTKAMMLPLSRDRIKKMVPLSRDAIIWELPLPLSREEKIYSSPLSGDETKIVAAGQGRKRHLVNIFCGKWLSGR